MIAGAVTSARVLRNAERFFKKSIDMTTTSNTTLAEPWRLLWNGDLSHSDQIIAEDFVAHVSPMTGSDSIRGRAPLNAWIGGIHALMAGFNSIIEVGPIADADTLRVVDGLFTEYWVNIDSLVFRMRQNDELPREPPTIRHRSPAERLDPLTNFEAYRGWLLLGSGVVRSGWRLGAEDV